MLGKQVETAYGEEDYLTYIENARRIVDSDISKIMPIVTDLGLREKIKYVLRTRG